MGSVVDSSALLFRSSYFYEPLTGLGERSHLVTREIGLDTHIIDVTQVLEHEDLNEVTLVGHSYGGLVEVEGLRDDIGAKSGFYFNIMLLRLALKFSASTSHHYLGRRSQVNKPSLPRYIPIWRSLGSIIHNMNCLYLKFLVLQIEKQKSDRWLY